MRVSVCGQIDEGEDRGGSNKRILDVNTGPFEHIPHPYSLPLFLLSSLLIFHRSVPSISAQYGNITKIPVPVTAIMDGYVS